MSENNKKHAVEVIKDEKVPEVVPTQSKKEFANLIEAYAKKNPVKYALKEKALKAKLATL